MTQDEIIEIASQVYGECVWHESALLRLEAFVKLVAEKAAAKEREECAKVCEAGINNATDWDSSYWDQACENRALAIRAKGEA